MSAESGNIHVKLFQRDYYIGKDADGQWVESPATRELADLDRQISQWVQDTAHQIVFVSAPGYHVSWLDTEHQTKHIIVGVSVLYRPAVVPDSQFRVRPPLQIPPPVAPPDHDSEPRPVAQPAGTAAQDGGFPRKEIIL